MMKQKTRARAIAGALLAVGAFALAGCAADPDMTPLQSELAGIDGVNGAQVTVQHSGAPWNTSLVVSFYLDDPTDEMLTRVVEDAVPALAADSTASKHDVAILFYDGVLAEYDEPGQATGDRLFVPQVTYDALGVAFVGGESVRLTPEDLARLASSS